MTPTNEWKEFEKLAASFEQSLDGTGAIFKSPDKVPDIFSGRLREVDATIRAKSGSVEILITMECRRRGAIQDVLWIEQLATKRASIGAAHTIAVSSAGFTKPAIEKAKLVGIETRILADVTQERLLDWVQRPKFLASRILWELKDFKFSKHDKRTLFLTPRLKESLKSEGKEAKILEDMQGKSMTIRQFVEDLLGFENIINPSELSTVPVDRVVEGSFDRPVYAFGSNKTIVVPSFLLEVAIAQVWNSIPVNLEKAMRYGSPDEGLAERYTVSSNDPDRGMGLNITYIKRLKS